MRFAKENLVDQTLETMGTMKELGQGHVVAVIILYHASVIREK